MTRARVREKCKHGHVLQGNTCRVVPVKINHAPVGRTRTRTPVTEKEEESGGEEIREKGSDPCQPVSFCPVPFLSLSLRRRREERSKGKDSKLPW